MNNAGIKINKIEVQNNKYLRNLKLSFIEENDELKGNYYSVLIGENGTGKSYVLRTIIDIFREINDVKIKGKRSYYLSGDFIISYFFQKDLYEISTSFKMANGKLFSDGIQRNTLFVKKNEETIDINDTFLPEMLIANTITLFDKFPVLEQEDNFKIYKYLGVRKTPNMAGTKSHTRRTAQHIVDSSQNQDFINGIGNILDFLHIQGQIVLRFKPRYFSQLYRDDVNIDDLKTFFNEYAQKTRKTKLWGDEYFRKNEDNPDFLTKIINGLKLFRRKIETSNNNFPKNKDLELELTGNPDIKKDFELYQELKKLDLIEVPRINIVNKKNKSEYSFEESSSGEYQIFTSLIGLMATIKDNSIILIDEPEISMHPNWQMRYFEILRKIFECYKGCHFVVATHSHFLISDLQGDSSKIIGLKRSEDKIDIVDLPKDINTYGWSAEEVLLKVFKVTTTRNYYVAEKLGAILDFIASEESTELQIKAKFFELELDKVSGLTNEDPLKSVYDLIMKEYVS